MEDEMEQKRETILEAERRLAAEDYDFKVKYLVKLMERERNIRGDLAHCQKKIADVNAMTNAQARYEFGSGLI